MREKEQPKESVLGASTVFKGKMKFEGSLTIKGRYDGSIESKGNILVQEGAMVKASLKAKSLELLGQLYGDVKLADKLEIGPEASLIGNAEAKSISLEQGAVFRGQITMLSNADLVDIFSTSPHQLKKLLLDKNNENN
jgi:cytoskeletal protein CcmA (bactofilin family)